MHYQCKPFSLKRVVLGVGVMVVLTLIVSQSIWQVRGRTLSERDYAAAQTAYALKDWTTAQRHFQDFLSRNPDNVEVLKKFAQAGLKKRPFEPMAIYQAVAVYLRVIQLEPHDDVAYRQVVRLLRAVHNFEELACVARQCLAHRPTDKEACLWLAEALIGLDKIQDARKVLEPYIAEVKALPDDHDTHVYAFLLMSQAAAGSGAQDADRRALNWLNQAVAYAPTSVQARAQRAKFYADHPNLSSTGQGQALDHARQDLETADTLGTDNPHQRLSLGRTWMALGETERAQAELQALVALDQTSLEDHYLDLHDWHIERYFFASELALGMGVPAEAAALADEALSQLQRPGHRMRVLPSIIRVYVAAGRVPDARRCLDEYAQALNRHKGTGLLGKTLAKVQAQVAQAEAQLQQDIGS